MDIYIIGPPPGAGRRLKAAPGAYSRKEDARTAARALAGTKQNPMQVYQVQNLRNGDCKPIGPPIRPAALEVTDRAYRYRAQRNSPGGKHCLWCGAPASQTRLEVAHIDGHEEHNDTANLGPTCRPCNVRVANTMQRAGAGRRTRQYNPEGATSLAQYIRLVLIMRGEIDGDGTSPAEAAAAIRATPPETRSEYAKDIWRARRKKYGKSGRQDSVPF